MTILVIAAAGLGSRFAQMGFTQPKPAIPLLGKPLLWWSLIGLIPALGDVDVRVVLREEQALGGLVEWVSRDLGISPIETAVLQGPTSGQAATVLAALSPTDESSPLIVWNADTYVAFPPGIGFPPSNWLHLFPSTSPAMSYAKIVSGNVIEVAEKRVISPWASSGLYSFESVDVFSSAYRETYEARSIPRATPETYVAPLYQWIIEQGWHVSSMCASASDVIPIGTPRELASAAENEALRSIVSARES